MHSEQPDEIDAAKLVNSPDGQTDKLRHANMINDKQLFHEFSGSHSSQHLLATRKTAIQQSNSVLAQTTSGNETNQWQTSSGRIETAEGNQETINQESANQLKNNTDDDDKRNYQIRMEDKKQQSDDHLMENEEMPDDSQTQHQERMNVNTFVYKSSNARDHEQKQVESGFQILPITLDNRIISQSHKVFNSQQVSSRVIPNNSSRDSSQTTQRMNNAQMQYDADIGFFTPQSRAFQFNQKPGQQQDSQQNQSFLNKQRSGKFQINQTKFIGAGGVREGEQRNQVQHSIQSKQSRRSKQSKKSESTSYGKSSSLKQFQLQVPKKEFRDEPDNESIGNQMNKSSKMRPPQNRVAIMQDEYDSGMNNSQQKSIQTFYPTSKANTPRFPSQAAQIQKEEANNFDLQQELNLNRPMSQQRHNGQFNDHSMVLFHNSNLSGLQQILSNL